MVPDEDLRFTLDLAFESKTLFFVYIQDFDYASRSALPSTDESKPGFSWGALCLRVAVDEDGDPADKLVGRVVEQVSSLPKDFKQNLYGVHMRGIKLILCFLLCAISTVLQDVNSALNHHPYAGYEPALPIFSTNASYYCCYLAVLLILM